MPAAKVLGSCSQKLNFKHSSEMTPKGARTYCLQLTAGFSVSPWTSRVAIVVAAVLKRPPLHGRTNARLAQEGEGLGGLR